MSVPRMLKAVEGAEKSRTRIPCDVPSLQALSSQAGLFFVSDGCWVLGGGPVRTSLLGGRGEAEMNQGGASQVHGHRGVRLLKTSRWPVLLPSLCPVMPAAS